MGNFTDVALFPIRMAFYLSVGGTKENVSASSLITLVTATQQAIGRMVCRPQARNKMKMKWPPEPKRGAKHNVRYKYTWLDSYI